MEWDLMLKLVTQAAVGFLCGEARDLALHMSGEEYRLEVHDILEGRGRLEDCRQEQGGRLEEVGDHNDPF